MNKEQILKEAIERAVENGYKYENLFVSNSQVERREIDIVYDSGDVRVSNIASDWQHSFVAYNLRRLYGEKILDMTQREIGALFVIKKYRVTLLKALIIGNTT